MRCNNPFFCAGPRSIPVTAILAFTIASCSVGPSTDGSGTADLSCAPDNDGLVLPDGFCAVVVADSVGRARHIVVDEEGDVYVRLSRAEQGGTLVALRDTTGDGRADQIEYFGNPELPGTGMALAPGYLWFSSDVAVFRQPLAPGELAPSDTAEQIAGGFGTERQHAAKSFTLDGAGSVYVNVGAPANACQQQMRTAGSPGQDPCPLLERFGGVWKFDATRAGQTQAEDGHRYGTGMRNLVAIEWNPVGGALYAVQHGRDQLNQLWPDLFTEEQNAELPAEEFFRIEDGDDFGWPYCYYDWQDETKKLAPEYGGDGTVVGRCAEKKDPIVAFPGHFAPNDLVFYTASGFPERYANGAFVAFHGSWNRAPLPQQGYLVAFVPMDGSAPSGDWEVFADGFDGVDGPLENPGDARHRPMGLAVGPDGSLYIADSVKGRIWRILYKG